MDKDSKNKPVDTPPVFKPVSPFSFKGSSFGKGNFGKGSQKMAKFNPTQFHTQHKGGS
jgi:hypothetical protein